jgi:hypothetical protein
MFVRVRKSKKSLRLSLVGTKRVGGKVKHEHITSLGSIPQTMTVAERLGFWEELRKRLPGLANRIDPARLDALIAAKIPRPTKTELDVADLEEYASRWQQIAKFFEPHKYEASKFKKAMHDMSEAVAQKTHENALARVAMAKDRIERVKRGEDAGLKKPFSVHDPAYIAAGNNLGRKARGLYLIDESQLNDLLAEHGEDANAELEKDEAAEGRWQAKRKKRSDAARRGWQNRFDPEYIPPIRRAQIFPR